MGDLPIEKVVKIAKMKLEASYAIDIKGITKEVIGSCLSMGVKVDGKLAKDVYKEISSGNYDDKLV